MDTVFTWLQRLLELIATRLLYVPLRKKAPDALKVGLLASDDIEPSSVIHPVWTSFDLVLHGIAASNTRVAQASAKRFGFQRAYISYEALLSDPAIDFVYISLPTHLHFEWAYKALEAGKHVLIDAPLASNGFEASKLVAYAHQAGRVLMEAAPSSFNPSIHRLRELLDHRKLGAILKVNGSTFRHEWKRPSNDPSRHYHMSGGSLMTQSDVISLCRFVLRIVAPSEVIQARSNTTLDDPRVDTATQTTLHCRRSVVGQSHGNEEDVVLGISTKSSSRLLFGMISRLWEIPILTIDREKALIIFYNATSSHLFQLLTIQDKRSGKWTYDWSYAGGTVWKSRGAMFSAQCYVLEAFVDKLKGRKPSFWIDGEDSVRTMETIDAIYRKAGLPVRPTSAIASNIEIETPPAI